MVFLELLLIVDMCLSQVKDKTNNTTIILSGLALVIVMEDFYHIKKIYVGPIQVVDQQST